MNIEKVHKASCHCGAIKFELQLPNGLENPRRCDCSMCRKRGAVVASISLDGLKIISGQEKLTLYQLHDF